VGVGEGIAGWVVASGQPIAIADVTEDPRFAHEIADRTGYVPRSIVAMPLETERAMVGVIEVLDARALAGGEMPVLALFARQAALALEAEQVFGDLGRVLFEAAAKATGEPALAARLSELAHTTAGPSRGLATLSAQIAELVRLGPAETEAAAALIGDLLTYARGRRP
jgi:GAF domain-containing protein